MKSFTAALACIVLFAGIDARATAFAEADLFWQDMTISTDGTATAVFTPQRLDDRDLSRVCGGRWVCDDSFFDWSGSDAHLNVYQNDFGYLDNSGTPWLSRYGTLDVVGDGTVTVTVPYSVSLYADGPSALWRESSKLTIDSVLRHGSATIDAEHLLWTVNNMPDPRAPRFTGTLQLNLSHTGELTQYNLWVKAAGQSIQAVPEPETYALLGTGLFGLGLARRLRAKGSRKAGCARTAAA